MAAAAIGKPSTNCVCVLLLAVWRDGTQFSDGEAFRRGLVARMGRA